MFVSFGVLIGKVYGGSLECCLWEDVGILRELGSVELCSVKV